MKPTGRRSCESLATSSDAKTPSSRTCSSPSVQITGTRRSSHRTSLIACSQSSYVNLAASIRRDERVFRNEAPHAGCDRRADRGAPARRRSPPSQRAGNKGVEHGHGDRISAGISCLGVISGDQSIGNPRGLRRRRSSESLRAVQRKPIHLSDQREAAAERSRAAQSQVLLMHHKASVLFGKKRPYNALPNRLTRRAVRAPRG